MTQASPEVAPVGATEMPFQAEVQQVLGLVIHSLYANQEVFLRELISNASDALDKARFFGLTEKEATPQVGEPRISIRLDEDTRTLTIDDNGIGMTRDEAVQNLGTIARSGSLEFLKAHAEAAKSKDADLRLIGQFGVGFYAAFMVASRVDVSTRSMIPGEAPVIWRSTGAGTFTIAPGDRETPGTQIVLHLKEECREFAKAWRVREIIRKYSDFVQYPIYLGDEVANQAKAIWALPKSQVSAEQHTEFYRHLTGTDDEPLLTVHLSVDAPVQFHALLYVPRKAAADLFARERRGLSLYAKRVLIQDDCERLVPPYLRFLRGVVDSEDLSLNVSREMLQEDRTLAQIEQQLTRQTLKALKELAETDAEKYDTFFREFGRVLKEGVTVAQHKTELAELCRFESMKTEAGKLVSLRHYVDAMPEAQREIYYVTGPNRRAVEESPHLEAFKKRGFDVLFLLDPVDEWLVKVLTEFDKRRLKSIAHGDVELGDEPVANDAVAAAIKAVKGVLGERVKDVRVSNRLTDSVSCLVAAEGDLGANLERLLKLAGQPGGADAKRILELNAQHPIVKNLEALAAREPESPRIAAWAELLLDRALLAEGIVEDPAKLVKRLEDLLTEVSASASS